MNEATSTIPYNPTLLYDISQDHGCVIQVTEKPPMQELPESYIRAIRGRQSLLWVVQRYDLELGEDPHDYSVPESIAKMRYRRSRNEADNGLTSQFWEAVWLEGASSPLLEGFRNMASKPGRSQSRSVVELVTRDDCDIEISSSQFLAVSILPGLIDHNKPEDAQYGQIRSAKSRERVSERLAERLQRYPMRLLVVIGAEVQSDLDRLNSTLEEIDSFDFKVLIVSPKASELNLPNDPCFQFHFWQGTVTQFLELLKAIGAPNAFDCPEWSLRIGNTSLHVDPRNFQAVEKQFAVIHEKHLVKKNVFQMEDLRDFFDGSLDNWTAFNFGLPVPRSYRSKARLSLVEEVIQSLEFVSESNDDSLTRIIEFPCESGAGATTMMREAAFRAAEKGFPTLILRPNQIEINVEQVVAFITHVTEASLRCQLEVPTFLIILDEEHVQVAKNSQIAGRIALAGKRAVVLRASRFDPEYGDKEQEERNKSFIRLPPVLAKVYDDIEIQLCQKVFTELCLQHRLPIEVPDIRSWRILQQNSWITPEGESAAKSNFWVALEHFLTSGMDYTNEESFKDVLGKWIDKRHAQVTNDQSHRFLNIVASLSSFYLIAPFWSVVRSTIGNTFSTQIRASIRLAFDLLEWGESSSLADQTLRFKHPSLALEILRRQGIRTKEERLELLRPLFKAMNGKFVDIWLTESVVFQVISPSFEEKQLRSDLEWDWRLEAFSMFPPVVAERSRSTLLHWARCLYLSAEKPRHDPEGRDERNRRLLLAIEKLEHAISIPRRDGIRDESLSNLYNTLGAAWDRYRRFLEEGMADTREASEAWDRSCDAFEKAIQYSGGVNVEALLAFSNRLIKRVTNKHENPTLIGHQDSLDLIRALGFLDEVEETLETSPNPDPRQEDYMRTSKAEAVQWLNKFVASKGGRDALRSISPDLASYCEARLICRDRRNSDQIKMALDVFSQAEINGIHFGPRPLLFWLSLLRLSRIDHSTVKKQLEIYDLLELANSFSLRPIDKYRRGVLRYHVNDFRLGAEEFRKLREESRRSEEVSPRVTDLLLDLSSRLPRRMSLIPKRIVSEFRGYGNIEEMGQEVPFRPRHWREMPKEKRAVECVIQFDFTGPRAIPMEFVADRFR
jgi:hypothetical protein